VPGLLKCIAKQGYLASCDPTEAKACSAQFQTAHIILMRIRSSRIAFTAQLAHRLRCSSDGVGNVPSSAARATWPSAQIYGCHPAVLLLRPRRQTRRCVRVLHWHSYQRGPSHVSIGPSSKRGRGDTQRGDHPARSYHGAAPTSRQTYIPLPESLLLREFVDVHNNSTNAAYGSLQ